MRYLLIIAVLFFSLSFAAEVEASKESNWSVEKFKVGTKILANRDYVLRESSLREIEQAYIIQRNARVDSDEWIDENKITEIPERFIGYVIIRTEVKIGDKTTWTVPELTVEGLTKSNWVYAGSCDIRQPRQRGKEVKETWTWAIYRKLCLKTFGTEPDKFETTGLFCLLPIQESISVRELIIKEKLQDEIEHSKKYTSVEKESLLKEKGVTIHATRLEDKLDVIDVKQSKTGFFVTLEMGKKTKDGKKRFVYLNTNNEVVKSANKASKISFSGTITKYRRSSGDDSVELDAVIINGVY